VVGKSPAAWPSMGIASSKPIPPHTQPQKKQRNGNCHGVLNRTFFSHDLRRNQVECKHVNRRQTARDERETTPIVCHLGSASTKRRQPRQPPLRYKAPCSGFRKTAPAKTGYSRPNAQKKNAAHRDHQQRPARTSPPGNRAARPRKIVQSLLHLRAPRSRKKLQRSVPKLSLFFRQHEKYQKGDKT